MKARKAILITLVFVLLMGWYYAPFVNFRKLYYEIEIERWADRVRDQRGVGRDCSHVSYDDVNRILGSMAQKKIEGDSGVRSVELPINCLEDMNLVRMSYFADYNVVSGVYRCEKDGVIQELQLAIYLEPRYVPQKNDCKVGKFLKTWNIPLGEATMFSLP